MHRTLFVSALMLAALTACTTKNDQDPKTDIAAGLERFSTCGAMETYLVDAYTEQLVGGYGYWGFPVDDAAEGDAPNESDGGGAADYSTTNNQEEGVDEPDIVKNDGEFIYIAQWNNEISVVDAWPPEQTHEVAKIELESYPYSLFLNGDTLVAFSYAYDMPNDDGRYYYGTRVSFFDVSDPANPVATREIDLEGYLSTARMIGTDVYSVVNTYAYMPDAIWQIYADNTENLPTNIWEGTEAEQEAKREEARRILRPLVAREVANLGVETLLPKMWDHAPGEIVDSEPLVSCNDVFHGDGLQTPAFLTIAHVDLAEDDGDVTATSIVSEGWTIYASDTALYVAQASYYWWWGYGEQPDYTSHIHKFVLDGANTVYEASGAVDGYVGTSYGMDEDANGLLRVATTDIDWWWGGEPSEETPANNVFVLEQSGGSLDTVGEIRGIAPGEQIYASRFTDSVGYLVTFRQIDPLFTIDFSNPRSPSIAGELQLPGYSAYLKPIDGGKLLAVGMGGDMDGNVSGLAINLFDVSDIANPTLENQLVVGAGSDSWASSDALWDAHAFTFHRNNLTIPMYTSSYDTETGIYSGFSGLLSVDVDAAAGSIAEVGRIDHSDLVNASECRWNGYYGGSDDGSGGDGSSGAPEPDEAEAPPYGGYGCDSYYWYASMRRSIVMEDNLYSISDYGVKVTDLAAPSSTLATVVFHPLAE